VLSAGKIGTELKCGKTKVNNTTMQVKFVLIDCCYCIHITADVEDIWSFTEAAQKLQATSKKRNEWRAAFREGMNLNVKVLQDTFGEPTEEDFMARYDLTFLSPRSQSIRCKVRVSPLERFRSVVSVFEFRGGSCRDLK